MKKVLILFCCLLAGVILQQTSIFGQEQVLIKGKVTGEGDNTGLPGAAVVELDKNNRVVKGTIADADGNYALQMSNRNNKIQFSFIGYKTQLFDVKNSTTINVALSEDIQMLDAVEVVAEGRTNTGFLDIKDRDLAIPVEKISTKEIESVQASSIDEALQGRLAGVDIVSNSGDPGGGMSIRIRGVSTLNANSRPLIVVDNVPFETNISPDFDFATANEEGYAQMLNISVDDIKEITVLKDAAATALWGTKAANGVLAIITKRGTKGMKPMVTYTYRGTLSLEPEPIPLLSGDEYSTLILEGTMNVTGLPLNTINNKEFQYEPTDTWWYHNYSQNTNWLKEISRNGYIHNHDFSLTGGGTKAFYRFSTNYQDQTGVTLGTDLKRLTTRLNLDYAISDKLMLRADFSYAHGYNHLNYAYGSSDPKIRDIAYRKMPNMSVYEFDQNGEQTPVFFSPEYNIQGTYRANSKSSTYNPVAMAESGIYKTNSDRIDTKFSLSYTIFEGLRYEFNIAFDITNDKNNWFLPQIATGRPLTDLNVNKAAEKDADNYTIYTNNQLTYHKNFRDVHDLTAVINFQSDDYRGVQYSIITSNTASSELRYPSVQSRIQEEGLGPTTNSWQNRDNGLLAMVHYSLLDRYIVSAGARREGNSKFDEKFRYGIFPSLSAAWRLSGEPFMRNFTFIDDLRLRASYGQNGHAPKNSYTFFNNYETFDWTYLGSTAVYPKDMQLENLKWESFITNNVGITLEMFKSRIMLDFDLYKNQTKDMFGEKVGIPASSGYENITMNIGSLDNQGWDFSFRSYPVKNDNLSVSLDFNISRNNNVLREVADNYPLERGRTTTNGDYKRIIQIDNPIGSFYGYRYLGVYADEESTIAVDENGNKIYDPNGNPIRMVYNYPSVDYEFQPGDAKYEDINHDGNINYLDVVYLGDANPDFTGGFGSIIRYKNISFNYYFYGRYGNDIINETKMYGESMFSYDNQTAATLRRWRNPGDITDIPRALIGYGYNWLGSDRFVDDGSFIRLKYITLTYYFPTPLLARVGLKSLRLSVTMNNLLTFTNYLGQDPEININSRDGTIYTVGYDRSNTPRQKEITFNISVSF
jgi:TonB-linked SusC/RagA family outer membrane protein